MSIPRWSEKYVGIEYDDYNQHCWWLIKEVFMNEKGIVLPSYAGADAKTLMKVARLMHSPEEDTWIPVAHSSAFDVIQMTARRIGKLRPKLHVGVAVSDTHVLHIEERTSSVIVPLDHPTIKFRIAGIYRHAALSTNSGQLT